MKNKILIFFTAIAILLFSSTISFAQQTKINFNKDGETVFQKSISDIDSIVFKQLEDIYIVNISEETDFDLLIASRDGSSVFLKVDENTELPTQLFCKPDKDSDEGYSIFFQENGFPEIVVTNDYIVYFGNFRENLCDVAIIHPDSTIEYFYDIESDIDWDSFLSSSISSRFFNLNKIIKGLSQALNVVSCATVLVGNVTGLVSCGSLLLDALGYDNPVLSLLGGGVATAIGCAGDWNRVNQITCFIDLANFAVGGILYGVEYLESMGIILAQVETHINTPRITINTQPNTHLNIQEGSIPNNLNVSVGASVTHSATLSYQWYSNTTNSNTGGTIVSDSTSANFTIPATLTVGTYYYFCEVNATGGAVSLRSSVTTVNVSSIPVITIIEQPINTAVAVGGITGSLSVLAEASNGAAQLSMV